MPIYALMTQAICVVRLLKRYEFRDATVEWALNTWQPIESTLGLHWDAETPKKNPYVRGAANRRVN